MIDAKKELQYRLAVRMLEHLAEIGLLSAEELSYAKRLAREKYSPQTVWEYGIVRCERDRSDCPTPVNIGGCCCLRKCPCDHCTSRRRPG